MWASLCDLVLLNHHLLFLSSGLQDWVDPAVAAPDSVQQLSLCLQGWARMVGKGSQLGTGAL